jgi:hypothetical protein
MRAHYIQQERVCVSHKRTKVLVCTYVHACVQVQRFHCDATHDLFADAKADDSHRLYNVFIPLVDLIENGDGTEFWEVGYIRMHTLARTDTHMCLSVSPCRICVPRMM